MSTQLATNSAFSYVQMEYRGLQHSPQSSVPILPINFIFTSQTSGILTLGSDPKSIEVNGLGLYSLIFVLKILILFPPLQLYNSSCFPGVSLISLGLCKMRSHWHYFRLTH